jgi:hypothetical protein
VWFYRSSRIAGGGTHPEVCDSLHCVCVDGPRRSRLVAWSLGDRSLGDAALWATRRRRPCATRPEARLRKSDNFVQTGSTQRQTRGRVLFANETGGRPRFLRGRPRPGGGGGRGCDATTSHISGRKTRPPTPMITHVCFSDAAPELLIAGKYRSPLNCQKRDRNASLRGSVQSGFSLNRSRTATRMARASNVVWDDGGQ